jgi:hypothetical protein
MPASTCAWWTPPRPVVTDAPPPPDSPDSAGARAYRRGFKRAHRGEDYALDLFAEAERDLTDTARVSRILLELSRYYNPLIHGPIVDLDSRRLVLEAVEAGRLDEARRVLQERRALYQGPPQAAD